MAAILQNPVARQTAHKTATRVVSATVIKEKVPKALAVAEAKMANVKTTMVAIKRIQHPNVHVQSPAVIRRGVHTSLRFQRTEDGFHEAPL